MRNVFLITGTTLIAVHTYQEVVIAADTKLRKVGNREARDAGRARKIGNVGNVFFAAAGLLGDTQGKFNLGRLVSAACEGNPPFLKKVERFSTVVQPPLIEIIQDIKTDHPDYYRSELDNKFVLQMAFGAFENGRPHLHTLGCKSVDNAKSLEIVNDPSGNPGWVALGQNSEIYKFVGSNPSRLFASGWRVSIEKLIALEAQQSPDKVGLPVDIVHISAAGATWL